MPARERVREFQHFTATFAGKQRGRHMADINGGEKYVEIINPGLIVRLTDQRGIRLLLSSLERAQMQARATHLPGRSNEVITYRGDMTSRMALGPAFACNITRHGDSTDPYLGMRAGPVTMFFLDQQSIDGWIAMTRRAQRMSTELPGGLPIPQAATYDRLRAFARTRGLELGEDLWLHDQVLAIAREEDVRWLDHCADRPWANLVLDVAKSWAVHTRLLANGSYLNAEPLEVPQRSTLQPSK